MNNEQTIQMLNRVESEISELRRQISVLAPKAEAYDVVYKILNLMPSHGQGMSEDFLWIVKEQKRKIQDRIIEEKMLKEAHKVNSDEVINKVVGHRFNDGAQ